MDWNGFDVLERYAGDLVTGYDQISKERKEALDRLAASIVDGLTVDGSAAIIFICTHNSRRSQIGQLWAQLASWFYGVDGITCFSGGTEVTMFNPLAVKVLKKAGFSIRTEIPGFNAIYRVSYPGAPADNRSFSKRYTDPPNPPRGFIAVMTCSDADEACPIVHGASSRHAIRYEDPKAFNGTPWETEGYDNRCREIAREMFYLFSRVSAKM
jgi:arsenate reductase